MGFKLYQAFLDAGLPGPAMRLEADLGGGPEWDGYAGAAAVLRSALPKLIEYGIATAEEIDIDTYERRLRDEVVGQRGILMRPPMVSAWARKAPAPTAA